MKPTALFIPLTGGLIAHTPEDESYEHGLVAAVAATLGISVEEMQAAYKKKKNLMLRGGPFWWSLADGIPQGRARGNVWEMSRAAMYWTTKALNRPFPEDTITQYFSNHINEVPIVANPGGEAFIRWAHKETTLAVVIVANGNQKKANDMLGQTFTKDAFVHQLPIVSNARRHMFSSTPAYAAITKGPNPEHTHFWPIRVDRKHYLDALEGARMVATHKLQQAGVLESGNAVPKKRTFVLGSCYDYHLAAPMENNRYQGVLLTNPHLLDVERRALNCYPNGHIVESWEELILLLTE